MVKTATIITRLLKKNFDFFLIIASRNLLKSNNIGKVTFVRKPDKKYIPVLSNQNLFKTKKIV